MPKKTWNIFRRKSSKRLAPSSSKEKIDKTSSTSAEETIRSRPSTAALSSFQRSSTPSHDLSQSRDSLTQAAFSHALSHESDQFFSFSCNVALAGENPLFLRLVKCWKALWSLIPSEPNAGVDPLAYTNTRLYRKIFAVAVEIYFDFIDPTTADVMPLNLNFRLIDPLKVVFKQAAMTIPTSTHSAEAAVVPFMYSSMERTDRHHELLIQWWDIIREDPLPDDTTSTNADSDLDLEGYPGFCVGNVTGQDHHSGDAFLSQQSVCEISPQNVHVCSARLLRMKTRVTEHITIPAKFTRDIFNDVEKSVYQMVFQNTFPGYIAWRGRQQENSPGKSDGSTNSLRAKLAEKSGCHS